MMDAAYYILPLGEGPLPDCGIACDVARIGIWALLAVLAGSVAAYLYRLWRTGN